MSSKLFHDLACCWFVPSKKGCLLCQGKWHLRNTIRILSVLSSVTGHWLIWVTFSSLDQLGRVMRLVRQPFAWSLRYAGYPRYAPYKRYANLRYAFFRYASCVMFLYVVLSCIMLATSIIPASVRPLCAMPFGRVYYSLAVWRFKPILSAGLRFHWPFLY